MHLARRPQPLSLEVDLRSQLLAAMKPQPNSVYLAQIIASQHRGHSCLPHRLGLADNDYDALLQRHFHHHEDFAWNDTSAQTPGLLRQELLELRREEWQELRDLLLQGRLGKDVSEIWLAQIIAAACLGGSHLWRDLGLSSRALLRELLVENFPVLALLNTRDMRWKKFFYKQLCEQQGGYVCRSPSCDTCPTYQDCFGDES